MRSFCLSEPEQEVRVAEAIAPTMGAWEDPTEVNWGADDRDDEPTIPEAKEPIFKCTALYSYTVKITECCRLKAILTKNLYFRGSKSR